MWTLECDGDSLSKKRIWLRPGNKYLFGRTKAPDGKTTGFRIDDKSVSRQHLTLSVSSVRDGDGSRIYTRSEIIVRDENTKFMTEVDGVSIKGQDRVLKGDKHTFRLGRSVQVFTIRWQPVILTFSLTSKETRANKDPLAGFRNQVERLDIKVVVPYVIDATTHVVAGKRNTAKGLQALINGKYIVTEDWISKILLVTTPEDFDGEESLSSLEQDFDKHWPDPLEYLPARSKEPNERPATDFLPLAGRVSVFEGYTFVFCEQLQYETLQPPITNGGGKALYYQLNTGKTTTEEFVRYVKTVAGEKGLGEFEDGSEGKGVVVVKFRGKGDFVEWASQLETEVAQALDHRLIEQREFLEAILANDASMLRRPLLREDDDMSKSADGRTSPAPANTQHSTTSRDLSEPSQVPRKRKAIVSRFKGFDDDNDEDVKDASVSLHNAANASASQVLHINETCTQFNGGSSRKRPEPSSDIEDEEAFVDQLLPGATAMKRRRLADKAQAEVGGTQVDERGPLLEAAGKAVPRPKVSRELNIKDAFRERRKAEEEVAQKDEENLHETLEGMTVEEMKQLAVVEEMAVPQRHRPAQVTADCQDGRWDARWNGRKNFKKFRRKGKGSNARTGTSVIVALEEVKRKDYGIGEDYWLERDSSHGSRRRKNKGSEGPSQSTLRSDQTSTSHHLAEAPSNLATDSTNEVVDLDAPRSTRTQDRLQTLAGTNESRITALQPPIASANGISSIPTLTLGPKKRKKFAAAANDSDRSDSDDNARSRYTKRLR